MRLFRARLHLRSHLGTPLASDTLWGHIAWAIRWRDGESGLRDWLVRHDRDTPPLAISDPMPAGFLPRPLLPPPAPVWPLDERAYLEAKRRDRLGWIDARRWPAVASACDQQSIEEALRDDVPAPRTVSFTHAAINRYTGGTLQDDGGTLYAQVRDDWGHARGAVPFDLWIATDDQPDALRALLERALVGGYGRDAGGGLGRLTVDGVEAVELPTHANANAVMLLGHAVPRPTDPTPLFVRTAIRAGRLGGDFAVGPTPNGETIRQKRPVLALTAGSLLRTDIARLVVGQLVDGVHPDPCIRHCGMTVCLPLHVPPSVLEAAA